MYKKLFLSLFLGISFITQANAVYLTSQGGTATGTAIANWVLIGKSDGSGWTQVATSSIGISGGSGSTYTATTPIRVNGTVISTDFSTSTFNAFSGLNTFALASTTALSLLGNVYDLTNSAGVAGTVLQTSGGSGVVWRATSSLYNTASFSLSGLLSSTDWSTFNNRLSTTSAGILFPTFTYGSTTYGILTGNNSWSGLNTFTGGAVINNATATSFGFTSATGTSLFSTQGTYTNLIWTNATGTALSFTNSTGTNFFTTNASTTNLTFYNASGTNFTISGTNNYLPALSTTSVHFVGINGNPFRMSIDTYNGNSNFGSQIQFRNASSTSSSPTFTGAWTTIGSLTGATYTGNNFSTSSVVAISMQAAAQQNNSSNPTSIFFYTTAT